MSHQESTARTRTRTPAAIAADLRRVADMLDTVTAPMPDIYPGLSLQPADCDDDETIRVIDAIGQALSGRDGVSREMSDGYHHYGVYPMVGVVRVSVFDSISSPAARKQATELAALRAELAEAKAALAARDSRPQMAMETDERCPDPECGESLREIAAGLVGHCGRNCAPALVLPDNAVYWRIYRNSVGSLFVVCMQWFDEGDYDQSRFLNDLHYATEAAAYKALADAEVSS